MTLAIGAILSYTGAVLLRLLVLAVVTFASSAQQPRDAGQCADQVSPVEVEIDLTPELAIATRVIVAAPRGAGTMPEILDDVPHSLPADSIFRPPRAALV